MGIALARSNSGLGLRRAALRPIELGQIDQAHGEMRMVGSKRHLGDGERALVERLGLAVSALRMMQHGEIVERDGDVGVVGPTAFSWIDSERLKRARPRRAGLAGYRARRGC